MNSTLIALPFAGGNRYTLNMLRKSLPAGMDMTTPDLPGRSIRVDDAMHETLGDAVDDVYSQCEQLWTRPYLLFGHCMGALLAFELARKIASTGMPPPLHLFVCGCSAPSRVHANRLSANSLAESQALLRSFGVHEDLLKNESFVDMLQAALHADLGLYNRYEYSSHGPLQIPFTVIVEKENYISDADLYAWQEESTEPLNVYQVGGPLLSHAFELTPLFENVGQLPANKI